MGRDLSAGVEPRHEDRGAAERHGGQEAHERGVRVQRRRHQGDRIGAIADVRTIRTCVQRIRFDWTMPLGVPVVPDE
jgi:hypothetical protein